MHTYTITFTSRSDEELLRMWTEDFEFVADEEMESFVVQFNEDNEDNEDDPIYVISNHIIGVVGDSRYWTF